MARMTKAEYLAYIARTESSETAAGAAVVSRESDLHDAITDECRRRGWYVVHSRMDRRTTCGLGVPDFVIAADGGRTLWVECKRGAAKLTDDQAAAEAWLRKLGHAHIVVRSFDEFQQAVKG